MKKTIWQFTNQRKLTAPEFIDYFERKVFRTIRKYSMLPKSKILNLKKSSGINTKVLKHVLEKKFKIKFSANPDFSSENLSQAAEDIFKKILKGKFTGPKPDDKSPKPLYFLSDKEIKLYANLKGIKGAKRKPDKKIQELFEKFLAKNPDLEHNVVGALAQLS